VSSDRRYGRVILEGWIEEDSSGWAYLHETAETSTETQEVRLTGAGKVEIEYIDPPIVFNVGDVVRWNASGEVGVRVSEDRWVIVTQDVTAVTDGFSDEYFAANLNKYAKRIWPVSE
jgi:co-chaperonin GroES (HSP10)